MLKYTKAILWFVDDQLKVMKGKDYLPSDISRWTTKTKPSPQQGYDVQRQAEDNNCASHLLLNTTLILRGVPLVYSQEYATNFRYNIAYNIIEYHRPLRQQVMTFDLTEEGNEQPIIPHDQHQYTTMFTKKSLSQDTGMVPSTGLQLPSKIPSSTTTTEPNEQLVMQPTKPIIQARKEYLNLLHGTADPDPQHQYAAAQPTHTLALGNRGNRCNDIETLSHEPAD